MPFDAADRPATREARRPLPGPVRTTADLVHEALRADLLEGRLAAGTPLREADLARELNVSRTPVREALHRLEADGLVRSPSGRGVVVAGFAADDLAALGEGRALLDALAARTAVERVAPEAWRPFLDRLVALEEALALRGSAPARAIEAHRAFHLCLYELAFGAPVAAALGHVAATALDAYGPEVAEGSDVVLLLREHRSLLAEATSGDPDRATQAVADHARRETPLRRRPAGHPPSIATS